MDVKDFIEHHGVKGMRWGVRRSRSQLSKARASRQASDAPEHKQLTKIKKKSGRKLSNDQLREAIQRMQLEDQYSSAKLNTSALSKGQKVATTVLAVGTTVNAAIAFANSPAGKAVKSALTKKSG